MSRSGSYLVLEGGTYFARFQYTPALREAAKRLRGEEPPSQLRVPLYTKNEDEAWLRARDLIRKHKELKVFAASERDKSRVWAHLKSTWKYQLGQYALEDGAVVHATEQDVSIIRTGQPPQIEKNYPVMAWEYTPVAKSSPEHRELGKPIGKALPKSAPPPLTIVQDVDEDIVLRYFEALYRRKKLRTADRSKLLKAVEDFRKVSPGVTFQTADPDHFQALVDYWCDPERPGCVKGSTAKRTISLLSAAIEKEARRGGNNARISRNPIYRIEFLEDSDVRMPLTEAEVGAIRNGIDNFTDEEKLMLIWHVSTGIRPEGIYNISEHVFALETSRKGERYQTRSVFIPKDKKNTRAKGTYDKRWLPVPEAVLTAKRSDGAPLLPADAAVPFFKLKKDTILRNIGKKLTELGVENDFYGARHRAREILKESKVDEQISRLILGHTRQKDTDDKFDQLGADVHNLTYLKNPMWKIKPVIDLIGF